MASGGMCRTDRSDTWPHQPALQRRPKNPLPTESRPHRVETGLRRANGDRRLRAVSCLPEGRSDGRSRRLSGHWGSQLQTSQSGQPAIFRGNVSAPALTPLTSAPCASPRSYGHNIRAKRGSVLSDILSPPRLPGRHRSSWAVKPTLRFAAVARKCRRSWRGDGVPLRADGAPNDDSALRAVKPGVSNRCFPCLPCRPSSLTGGMVFCWASQSSR